MTHCWRGDPTTNYSDFVLDYLYGKNTEPTDDNVAALLYFAIRLDYPVLEAMTLVRINHCWRRL